VFSARIEDIRPENTVPLNSGKVLRGLFEITDFGRMAFHPSEIGDPRGRGAVRATAYHGMPDKPAGALAR